MNTVVYLKHTCDRDRPFAIWIDKPIGKRTFRETQNALLAAGAMNVWCPYCGTRQPLRTYTLIQFPPTQELII